MDKGTEYSAVNLNLRNRRNLWMIVSFAICTLINASASGATLYGKVVEINDGDTISIFNLNRTVRVRLLAVDAPDGEQPYAQHAKDHLASLILHKFVTVEYSGLAENSYLLGKVFLRDTDIGAQMLRDGVAWFDASAGGRLSDSDRQVYLACQQTARAELRGLWQDAQAVAPWEFKQRAVARAVAESRPENRPKSGSEPKPKGSQMLGSEDLLQGLAGSTGSNSVSPSRSMYSTTEDNEGWRTLAPEGEHFSVKVPVIGLERSKEVPAGSETATINYWFSDYEGASYLILWSRGPNMKYTDALAIEELAKGIALGLNRGFERRGIDLVFSSKLERNLKLDGYNGSQFSLTSDRAPGVIRAFSKQIGDRREMYLIGVLNSTEQNPNVEKFFRSLSLNRR